MAFMDLFVEDDLFPRTRTLMPGRAIETKTTSTRVITVMWPSSPQQFTRADITLSPTASTLWGGRSTLSLTDRDKRLLKLRAMRGVMY
jgi:hypothetical protein